MSIDNKIISAVINAAQQLYGASITEQQVQLQPCKAEFEGDLTVVVFPLLKISKKSPEQTAQDLGAFINENLTEVSAFNVVKGFLNLSVADSYWLDAFKNNLSADASSRYGSGKKLMVEYSSPNTNKPLHLGHIRNNFLGYSVAEILKANGNEVIKTQIINDRGIHICKSMLAWMKWGNGETPLSSSIKGDHLVGKYYVMFEQAYKKEMQELIAGGMDEKSAKTKAPLFLEASEMLRKWEAGDAATVELWKTMNSWVYAGFDDTYKKLGVDFDKLYYESNTYLFGKEIIEEGLKKGVFFKKEDGSVWIDLTADGLDEKLLLRSDGTAVYMTQDIGTAVERYKDFNVDGIIYTVANEQDYHFKVLFLILKKMGYSFWEGLFHLSYGMVELPSGRMKTREGTVVDADDLIDEMIASAAQSTAEKGKLDELSEEEKNEVIRKIALGALKYFILKVDPKKSMIFNPEESIDFNGNTGPFIQYIYVRTRSVLRKVGEAKAYSIATLTKKEKDLIKKILGYSAAIKEAGKLNSPAVMANYSYELAKDFSQFWADHQIVNADDENSKNFRVALSKEVGDTLKKSMKLLGIEMPERM
ncbi:MAG: arginine--tRNA ligase [Flavobacteriales bacterium]